MEISASWNREDEIEGVSSETQLRRNKRKLGKAEEAGIKGLDERKPKRCKILTQPTLPKEILDGFAENLGNTLFQAFSLHLLRLRYFLALVFFSLKLLS